MSIEALSWVFKHNPIPSDLKGKPGPAALTAVLVGLANHAHPDGTAAFPSVATLARYSRLSERTVQYALTRLVELGVIRLGNQAIVSAYISSAGARPKCYDLVMETPEPGSPLHPVHPTPAPSAPERCTLEHETPAPGAPEPSFRTVHEPSNNLPVVRGGLELNPREVFEPAPPDPQNLPLSADERAAVKQPRADAVELVSRFEKFLGHRVPGKTRKSLQLQVSRYLSDGVPEERIERAIVAWQQSASWSLAVLDSFVLKAAAPPSKSKVQENEDYLDQLCKQRKQRGRER